MLKLIHQTLFKYFDWKSILLFLGIFSVFYGLDLFWISMTSSTGKFFCPFVQTYLNYPAWIRDAVLFISSHICHWAGIPSVRSGPYLNLPNGEGIYMAYSCYGLMVMDLWLAFIGADRFWYSGKLFWILAGLMGIFLINIFRITLLVISLSKDWGLFRIIDHHTFFNLLSYVLIFFLVSYYYKRKKDQRTEISSDVAM
jgi:exosortase/archaeosortase family protein